MKAEKVLSGSLFLRTAVRLNRAYGPGSQKAMGLVSLGITGLGPDGYSFCCLLRILCFLSFCPLHNTLYKIQQLSVESEKVAATQHGLGALGPSQHDLGLFLPSGPLSGHLAVISRDLFPTCAHSNLTTGSTVLMVR